MFRSAVLLVRPLAVGVLLAAGGVGCGGAGALSPDGGSAGDGGLNADGGGADMPVIGGGPGTGGAGGQGIGGAGTGGFGTGGAGAGGAGTGGAGMGGAGGAGSAHPPLTGTITSTQTFADLGEVTTTSAQVAFVFAGNDSYDLYQVGSGTVSVHRDIVGNDCQAHLTFTGALGASDGSIILTPTGQYVASTSTVGTLTGTSACGTAAPEATTIPDQGMQWWPFPTTALLAVQPDGGLHDSFTETNADTGEVIQAQWLLVPTN